jgi:hypothetical protein
MTDALLRAERDGLASKLLDVQRECVELRTAMEQKIAKALPDIVPAVEDWLFNGASDQDAAKAIAAAIRAGE